MDSSIHQPNIARLQTFDKSFVTIDVGERCKVLYSHTFGGSDVPEDFQWREIENEVTLFIHPNDTGFAFLEALIDAASDALTELKGMRRKESGRVTMRQGITQP